MSIAITDEQRALREAVLGWAKARDTVAVTRGMEADSSSWRSLWPQLAEMGITSIALPDNGGTITDAACALEAAAEAMTPGPLCATVFAGALLGESAWSAGIGAGRTTFALVFDDDLRVDSGEASGVARNVVGADTATHLILFCGKHLSVVDAAEVTVVPHRATDLSAGLGDVEFSRTPAKEVPGEVDAARDLYVTLLCAELSGIAAACLRSAVQYAKTREQFGKSIGSFQAVKHLCADMACRVEESVALAWDAARAADADPDQSRVAAAAAAVVVPGNAVAVAEDCIQVLGGIGFTFENDAHLYLRKAIAARTVLDGCRHWPARAAELALGGARRATAIDLGARSTQWRNEIRAQAVEIASLPADRRRAALADKGLLAPHWPRPYGLNADAREQLIVDTELAQAGVSRPDLVIGGWAAPTILEHGTAEQINRFVAPTLRGEITWCQLFSEPEAGSDLASLRCAAKRADGGWLLSGQKVWTSLAAEADWAICLARTDSSVPKHKGITYFLVDMRSVGITVRPLREITGEAMFNEVFLDDVFVPDGDVVGQIDNGWRLARTTLSNERVAIASGSDLDVETEAMVSLARASECSIDPREIGSLVARAAALTALDVRTALLRMAGEGSAGGGAGMRKLLGVRHRQAVADASARLLGTGALRADRVEIVDLLRTRCLSIAGGTTQILLTMIGERALGLPREK
jgi:alkylation response protein AidB-like acyl-CoA dehydrogenase